MKEKTLVLKAITKAEFSSCREIRKKVFCDEQNVSQQAEFDGLDEESVHFLCLKSKAPIGTGRLRKTSSTEYKVERMAVVKENRSIGVGTKLLKAIINEWDENCGQDGDLVLHSQIHAVGFYEKEGFKAIGFSFQEEGIEHIKMVLDLKLRRGIKIHE